jgi:hypothetical protein
MSELPAQIGSGHGVSEVALEALSRRADAVEELVPGARRQFAALWVTVSRSFRRLRQR